MKKLIVILLYLSPLLWRGAGGEVAAQSPIIDSLYNQLSLYKADDAKHLNLLLLITEAEELSNPEKGIGVADKAIELAKKTNKESELAVAYNQKARLLIMKQLTDKANDALKQSILLNRKLNNKNQLAENDLTTAQFIFCQRKSDSTFSYINKSYEHFKNSENNFTLGKINLFYGAYYGFLNTDTAQIFYLKAKSYFDKCDRNDWLAYANFYLATNFTSLNSNAKALEYFKIAEDLNKSVHSDFIAENIYCTKGYLYFSLGDFPNAVNNFMPGLKMAERINDEMMQACLLGNLGAVTGSMKDYTRSGEYINKQITIAKKINDGYTLSSGYQNKGWIDYENQNYVDALKYFNMALQVALGIKQFDSMAECYGAIGQANEKLGNYNVAFANIYKALELNRRQGNYYNISDNLLALSRTILNSGNNKLNDGIGGVLNVSAKREKAIEFSIEALKIAENKNTLALKRDAFKQLSDLYSLTGDDRKSFNYYTNYIAIKDSIMSNENIKFINELQLEFETEKKEKQIALLTKESKLQQTELQKQNTSRNLLVIACMLIALLAGIIFNRYRIKQKANAEIETTLQHLKNTQEQLVEHEKLASLGKFTSDVAREIESPVKQINQLTKLNRLLIENYKGCNSLLDVESLKRNLLHIYNYGKEADAVVKKVLTETRKIQL
jgi:tetratricopeptide (TPR) repeat protein